MDTIKGRHKSSIYAASESDKFAGRRKFSFYEALKLLHDGDIRAIFLNEDLVYPTVVHKDDLEKLWNVKE